MITRIRSRRVAAVVLAVPFLVAGYARSAPAETQTTIVCSDFDDQTAQGWTATATTIVINAPGPSGSAGDYYLETHDLSGGSAADGPSTYYGDWTPYANDLCSTLSYDVVILNDGDPASPDITPNIYIYNTAAGLYAAFSATNVPMSEPSGMHPGWHHITAPIAPLDSGGNLPSGPDGAWVLGGSQPNSMWMTLLSNIDRIVLPVDYNSNPAEIEGYDNICLNDIQCSVPVQTTSWGAIKAIYR